MNQIKVSVCISVHNTAKYLPRCLDSVCSQTLQSLEIVLVNNGSTDNSEEIMHEYASRHPERKFVIVSQEDRSLAGGRQSGIDNATGEFITFLDADDYVENIAYQTMLESAEREGVEIVEMQTRRDGKILCSNMSGLYDAHRVLKLYFTTEGIQSMLWLRLYKHSLFDKPVLPSIYTNNEDMFAWPCLLHAANRIYFLEEPLHTYSTDNEQGVMHSETNNPELAERRFQSRRKALSAITHFKEYVGEDCYYEYENEHSSYSARCIFGFLQVNFVGKSMKDKEKAVIETLHFKSSKSLYSFLRKWLPRGGFNTYCVFRLLGIRASYCINHIVHKNIK